METLGLHVRQSEVWAPVMFDLMPWGRVALTKIRVREKNSRGVVNSAALLLRDAQWPPTALTPNTHSGFSGHRHVWH